MNKKKRLIEGYQPVKTVQTGNGNTGSTPVATVNITPPKGGTGEVTKKNCNSA